ncbi:site-specific integrase [Saccharomonospora sp. NPDC046836]|uniref:tyrosine-type recombinase/integrase n=1 Tax=Saccharomonospora sp. NPDC046836 TaxID=3156921 RepID=UPI0033EB3D17
MGAHPVADPAGPAEVEAARVLLARMGINPADLITTGDTPNPVEPHRRRPVPTFSEWIPVVAGLVSARTAATYGTYWRKIEVAWGTRRLDEPTASELRGLAEQARAQAVPRRNSRGGRGAAENLIAAARCLYRHAEADGLIDERANPGRRVTKPRRIPSARRALPDARIAELNEVVATTGDDPELDALIVRLHEETAARRGGALALRPRDLDEHQCLVLLREKGETVRWQPVSPTLMRRLRAHTDTRGMECRDGQLLRYADGRPITHRRYDHIWTRVARHLPWAEAQQVSTHWLRHTTLTWVERHFGYGVAEAFAGHTPARGRDSATGTYVKAGLNEVAAALAALTGEAHPLAAPHGGAPV